MLRLKAGNSGFVLQNADSFYRDSDRKLIILEGNVQVIYDQQHLSADRAVIYEATQELEAEGHLVINSPTVYVEGDRARFNYQTGEGIIYNGFVRSGQVVFEGRIVRKTGPDEYEAEAAYYTACTTCPPAWSFTGSRIQARLGGYAFIRNSVLEISHFPIFWLPYLIVPLKSERQTGFLIPTLDFSAKGGTAVGSSFFWAISRSQDATFTLKNYSFRGLKGLTNYRYVLTENSFGSINTALIKDKVFSGEEVLPPDRRGAQFYRWFFTFDNDYTLPYEFTQKARLNLVSDLLYPRDFPDEIKAFGDPALENRVALTRDTESTHSSIEVQHFQNLLKTNPVDNNVDAVHRFPSIRYSLIDREIENSGMLFRFDTEYVNFAREDAAFDDVTFVNGIKTIDIQRTDPGGGVFNPGVDVIRAGQRLDLQPEISRPFQIGHMIDVLPIVGLRYTQYAFDVNPGSSDYNTTPSRTYMRTFLGARTLFSRVLDSGSTDRRADRYKHEVEPFASVSFVPYLRQTSHDFFGAESIVPTFLSVEPVSNADFRSRRGIQFDYEDRLPTRNAVTFGLNNRLIRKTWGGHVPHYRQVVNFRLSQSYDIDEAQKKSEPRYPWSDISALLDVRMSRFETQANVRYYPYHNATNTAMRMLVKDSRGDYLELRVDQQFVITSDLAADYPGRRENIGIGAGFEHRYLSFGAAIDFSPRQWEPLVLKTKSWSADLAFRPPGDCWSLRASVRQELGQVPDYKFSFDYFFGGETK